MTTLEDLITRANNALGALENLIAGDASTTPVPDDSVSYTVLMPTYDELTDEWTLTQDSADTDGLYKGAYNLALESGCSIVTLVSHDGVTPDDGVPVRYRACDATEWTDLSTMTAVDGEEIQSLEFRSKNPFSITIKLTAVWRQTFDFTVDAQGWSPAPSSNPPQVHAQYVSGVGFAPATTSSTRHAVGIRIQFSQTFIKTIRIVISGDMDGNRDEFLIRDGSSGIVTAHNSDDVDVTYNVDVNISDLRIFAAEYQAGAGQCQVTILSVEVCGTGENPFSS